MKPAAPEGATVRYPLTIHYDGACPLCATEMRTLVALDVDGRLRLSDCAGGRLDDACGAAGVTSADLLAAIHARDADGRWLRGVDVFVAAYDAAGLRPISALLAHRRLRPWWDRLSMGRALPLRSVAARARPLVHADPAPMAAGTSAAGGRASSRLAARSAPCPSVIAFAASAGGRRR